MTNVPAWAKFEADVVHWLDLQLTTGSGNQSHDPGDATTYEHPTDVGFRLMADAKFTEHASFSVNVKFWDRYVERAADRGKRFIMPVRLFPRGRRDPVDVVVVGMDDFRELLASHRMLEAIIRENDAKATK